MGILKLKEWKKIKESQFEILVPTTSFVINSNGIVSVKRLNDGFVFDTYVFYFITGLDGFFKISKFHEDLIHVDYHLPLRQGTIAINRICMVGGKYDCIEPENI